MNINFDDWETEERAMNYEYVALIDQPRHGLHWDELVAHGWCEWMKIPFWTRPHLCGPGPSYVYIMRRPKIDEKLKERIMKEDSCKPECCVEEEETCTCEKTLLVLPIYNAYLRKTCYDSEQALRLTFIEIQRRVERALTWPNR